MEYEFADCALPTNPLSLIDIGDTAQSSCDVVWLQLNLDIPAPTDTYKSSEISTCVVVNLRLETPPAEKAN
jgi:hypothetical protein